MTDVSPVLNRRDAVRIGTAALVGAFVSQSPPLAAAETAGPSLHVYPNYGWLRGFTVVPSWGARIEEAWWRYDGARFREEVALAATVHANCLRLWIDFTAWMADPEKVTGDFFDAVKAIDEQGMKTMPCLFNRWHDVQWDYGGQYLDDLTRDWRPKLEYVRTLVKPLVADHRILMWDLCNEPQAANLNEDWCKREYQWLLEVAATARECGARQPITIGTATVGGASNVDVFAPLCDVICAHPYAHTAGELHDLIARYQDTSQRHRKVLLVNETIPGCLNDQRRAEVAKFYTEMLSKAGLGWMGWALREGKAISTRRDRYDSNGINGEGFHPFFTSAGKLRDGLEFLCTKPTILPPWTAASGTR
ncbi:cellulase family glycosylhydrolase [Schlesneria paludicola]|uniref:cellulase family glycosylhydrolase n=1 Tax=Schlesneria paludicola TaxID=360056 RepID=UPI000299D664|nr:cellulase family glycosylhydrolase [Schlesneria paludicola]